MRLDLMARTACLALMLGAPACARNQTDDQVGAAQDSTAAARSDTTKDQTQSGVTDSSGQSTLGKDVEKTRPDQGQPVTSKGDTINPGVDSPSARQGADSSSMQGMDSTSTHQGMDSTGMQGMDSTRMHQEMDTTSTPGVDSTQIRQGMDSTGVQR